ncbi:MAG: hypothetical protein ABGZ35_32120 [Planctomycetaceae bacterium]
MRVGLSQHSRTTLIRFSVSPTFHLSRENSPIRVRVPTMALVVFALVAAQVMACSIPVFRYALENWQPDPYVAYVLHNEDLTPEQQNLVSALRARDRAGSTSANLIVETIDLNSDPDEFATKLHEENASQKLPCLVVQTPARMGEPETVFSSDLTSSSVAQLVNSPLRTEIQERLLKGDSVVWVYLESGRTDKDDETYSMLTQELSRLQGELKLPEIEEEDLADLATSPESLKIQFSAVRLSRDNDQEAALRNMLLHVEHDLLDEAYADQPMAFPIFGRGRALYALVGNGVAPQLVGEACQFLTGACQCTVKAENPGVDLLMQVDWDNLVQPTEAIDASLPPLAGFTGFGQDTESSSTEIQLAQNTDSQGEQVPLSSAQPDSDVEPPAAAIAAIGEDVQTADPRNGIEVKSPSASAVWQNALFVLLFAGCVVVVATVFLVRRTGV